MPFINIDTLRSRTSALQQEFNAVAPFRHVVIDNFLTEETAEALLNAYPKPESGVWNKTTYINQKKKLQKGNLDNEPLFKSLFEYLNGEDFIRFVEALTGIAPLETDAKLFGAGMHQSLNGAFLDVHVDFNVHPETKLYRRLNLLIFLNKDWRAEYGGELELWDMEKKECFKKISPDFNRCVIFETNEKSFHGHPVPLNVPEGITRKSLAVYYYTKDAPAEVKAGGEHNSIFVSTQGIKGKFKNLSSGITALKERILQKLQ
jgi:Rps23 Pro-64 3,4-dihydroxylase Tpa1-like proline 4-hydroxylase